MVDSTPAVERARTAKVVIVEDDNLFRDLLRTAVSCHPGVDIVGSFGDAQSSLEAIPRLKPDVAVLDIELGGDVNGIQLGLLLRQTLPHLGVVLLSNYSNSAFLSLVPLELLEGWSYLLKRSISDVGTVVRAIESSVEGLTVLDPEIVRTRSVETGGALSKLSARQAEVLGLMAGGYSNAAIAGKLVVSEKTVENYISAMYDELAINPHDSNVNPRVRAVTIFLQQARSQTGRAALS